MLQPKATHRIDATLVFELKADALSTLNSLVAQVGDSLNEFGDRIVIEKSPARFFSIKATMRFTDQLKIDALEAELVTAAEKSKAHDIGTHECNHINGESCKDTRVVAKGGDLDAI